MKQAKTSAASPISSASETSDLGAAASALFNLRASPVVLPQKHGNGMLMPFLSLSPPVVMTASAPPPPSSFARQMNTTRARSQTWDASTSSAAQLASAGFLQQLVDTDANAAGTLCALMQSESPLITAVNSNNSSKRRQRSQSVSVATAQQQQQQERQSLKGLRPRSMSSMADHQMHSPVLQAAPSRARRPSRSMSMDSSLLGEEDFDEEDMDDYDEEDMDEFDDGEEVHTVVSLQVVGQYSPDTRRQKIERFADKRRRRIWRKRIKYDVRKNFADSRLRVKGRFVRKEDEDQLRDYLNMT